MQTEGRSMRRVATAASGFGGTWRREAFKGKNKPIASRWLLSRVLHFAKALYAFPRFPIVSIWVTTVKKTFALITFQFPRPWLPISFSMWLGHRFEFNSGFRSGSMSADVLPSYFNYLEIESVTLIKVVPISYLHDPALLCVHQQRERKNPGSRTGSGNAVLTYFREHQLLYCSDFARASSKIESQSFEGRAS